MITKSEIKTGVAEYYRKFSSLALFTLRTTVIKIFAFKTNNETILKTAKLSQGKTKYQF